MIDSIQVAFIHVSYFLFHSAEICLSNHYNIFPVLFQLSPIPVPPCPSDSALPLSPFHIFSPAAPKLLKSLTANYSPPFITSTFNSGYFGSLVPSHLLPLSLLSIGNRPSHPLACPTVLSHVSLIAGPCQGPPYPPENFISMKKILFS